MEIDPSSWDTGKVGFLRPQRASSRYASAASAAPASSVTSHARSSSRLPLDLVPVQADPYNGASRDMRGRHRGGHKGWEPNERGSDEVGRQPIVGRNPGDFTRERLGRPTPRERLPSPIASPTTGTNWPVPRPTRGAEIRPSARILGASLRPRAKLVSPAESQCSDSNAPRRVITWGGQSTPAST